MGGVKGDGWRVNGADVCHSFRENTTTARYIVALREERTFAGSWESLSEEAKRRTSGSKWKRDDQN